MLVKLLADHFDKDRRYVPAGTIVDVPDPKNLNVWMSPQDATAKAEMDKRFTPQAKAPGHYKRGTL